MSAQKIAWIFFLWILSSCQSNNEQNLIVLSNSRLQLNQPFAFKTAKLDLIQPEYIPWDSVFVEVAYALGNDRALIVARHEQKNQNGLMLHLTSGSPNFVPLFESRFISETWTLHPRVLLPDVLNQPALLFAAQGTSESWGQQVFVLYEDSLEEIGYLDVALKSKADTAFYPSGFRLDDISTVIQARVNNQKLEITFACDSLLLYGFYDETIDPTVASKRVSYSYNGRDFIVHLDPLPSL
jgi:hypothetical protein